MVFGIRETETNCFDVTGVSFFINNCSLSIFDRDHRKDGQMQTSLCVSISLPVTALREHIIINWRLGTTSPRLYKDD